MNYLPSLALQGKKKLYDSSRLDVVEVSRVAHVLPACFLPGRAEHLSATRHNTERLHFTLSDPTLVTKICYTKLHKIIEDLLCHSRLL